MADVALAWWDLQFSAAEKVPLALAIEKLKIRFPKFQEMALIVSIVIDFNSNFEVTRKEFENFFKIFGPFDTAFNSCADFVLNENRTFNSWWHGVLTHDEANAVISGFKQPDTFLIRFGSKGDCLAMVYSKQTGSQLQTVTKLIEHSNDRFQLQNSNESFLTLADLVKQSSHTKHSVPSCAAIAHRTKLIRNNEYTKENMEIFLKSKATHDEKYNKLQPLNADSNHSYNLLKPNDANSHRDYSLVKPNDANSEYNSVKLDDANSNYNSVKLKADANSEYNSVKLKADANSEYNSVKLKADANSDYNSVKPNADEHDKK